MDTKNTPNGGSSSDSNSKKSSKMHRLLLLATFALTAGIAFVAQFNSKSQWVPTVQYSFKSPNTTALESQMSSLQQRLQSTETSITKLSSELDLKTTQLEEVSSKLTSVMDAFAKGVTANINTNTNANLNSNAYTNTNAKDDKDARMLKYKTKYNYTLPSPATNSTECGMGPDFVDFFQLPLQVRSRMNEDKFVYETFFKNRPLSGPGTYIELGAYDGKQESNTRFFDLCLHWKGLLIEGNPTVYDKTVSNRPQAHRMSFAPSCSAEYEATNGTVQFSAYPLTNAGLKGFAKTYDAKTQVDVPCGPLEPVLEDLFEGQHINFFSLDVEGNEPNVLETIDFTKVFIDVLMIEIENQYCRGSYCEARSRVRAIMAEAGYWRYEGLVRASDIYVHPQSKFQIDRSLAVPANK